MKSGLEVLHLTAFSDGPGGGNPAGVVLDAAQLSETEMLEIAAELGYAESAFVTSPPSAPGPGRIGIRYFSPIAEVPFCGHATVATAVALADRYGAGNYLFETQSGEVELVTERTPDGVRASFTSVKPRVDGLGGPEVGRLLALLGLREEQLHPEYPPRIAFAGNPHPVLVIKQQRVFDEFSFDPQALREFMDQQGWPATVTVLHVLAENEFEARNLFPVGTLSEDPATGSAAASTGAYLRELGKIELPGKIWIRQGRHIGRPSLLEVDIPVSGGITVSGSAERITD
ncbi:PhzF family phenazine biosynthesis protein [Psychromicrobium sp. YIM B11713]|uniref:PhzF family phenazine biosynthesis protein n=1 Tax=Psychromicrobium sp. YIM B11713 TaxID=3145233 RepID=UPI00374EC2C8